MMNKIRVSILYAILIVFSFAACQKEETVAPALPQQTTASNESTITPSSNTASNDTASSSTNNTNPTPAPAPTPAPQPAYTPPSNDNGLTFAGMRWNVRTNDMPLGPGPNVFSKSTDNVYVDQSGYLHLKIKNVNGQWRCAELESQQTFGYGTYVFTVKSDVAHLDPNVVAGFFTWDNNNLNQANSEIDIEFAKWGNASDQYTYTSSVQPVKFDNPDIYLERTSQPAMNVSSLAGPSTHAFTWTSSLVTWNSYSGSTYPGNALIASWRYDNTNQPRIKYQSGQQSAPVVIPAPGSDTRVHINLWLLNGHAPMNGQEVEVVVSDFKYIPGHA
jgi:hypothetical protein